MGGRTEASAPTEVQQEVQWAGDRKGRPYGVVIDGAVCGGTHGSRPTGYFCRGRACVPCRECGVRIPQLRLRPVQPPLGKGAMGTGDADCHDQFANWSRNDTFSRSACVSLWCVGEGLCPSRRAGKSAKRRRWRMQRAGFEEVPRLADTTVAGNRLARRWAREPRPYEFFAIQILAIKKGCR